MPRMRRAVPEFALAGASALAFGLAGLVVAIAGGDDEAPIAGPLTLVLFLLLTFVFTDRRVRRALAEAQPDESTVEPRRPGMLALMVLAIYAAGAVLILVFGIPGDAYFAVAAGFGIWQLAIAARIRAWERRTGHRMLLRRVGRMAGRSLTDPANYVFR